MRVLVGMSGGVDSSMAAYLLKRQGYEVEGVSFMLFETRGMACSKTCCSQEAIKQASLTAGHIGIAHSAIDLRAEFMDIVIEPFIKAYSRGLTPNPCILCNRYIKFPHLLREAQRRGSHLIATGHYARLTEPSNSMDKRLLKKGIDPKKDQSYVLYCLSEEELKSLILPLGDFKKPEIRAMAGEAGLPAFKMPESQEICFIAQGNYSAFIRDIVDVEQGPILDMNGNVIGTHKGIYHYTLGQRKRLGISSREPLYVIKIEPERNAIYVGPKEEAFKREFFVHDLNWLIKRHSDFRADVKVRSMMKPEPAGVYFMGKDKLKVIYDEPQWAPARGQSAVFYDDDIVVGGGIIEDEL